jgi:hypothetical protein
MNDYAHLRLYQATIRGTRAPQPARSRSRRRRTYTLRLPAALTRLASGMKALTSAASA